MSTKTLVDTDSVQTLYNKTLTGPVIINPAGDFSSASVKSTGSTYARSLANHFGDEINVKDFGAIGDGIVDDTIAIQQAINAGVAIGGATIVFPGPSVGYRVTSELPVIGSSNIHLKWLGGGWISKEFNGDLFPVSSSNIKFENMVINANGGTYTGSTALFKANTSLIEWTGGQIIDGADSIFLFEDTGASQSLFHDFRANTHSALVTTGAVVKRTVSTFETIGSPRHFHHIIAHSGTWFAKVDGFHGAYFDHIYSDGMDIGDNSAGNTLNNCRFAITTGTMHISGNQTLVMGSEIAGNLTIDAGFINSQFHDNNMTPGIGTFTDNSLKDGSINQSLVEEPTRHIGRQVLVLATANLPVASASMDGRLIIEDAGTGDRNLIVYAGGERFRINGGANV